MPSDERDGSADGPSDEGDGPADGTDADGSRGPSDGSSSPADRTDDGDDRRGHPPDDALAALVTAYELKDEDRSGWVKRGVETPESVAAHTWGVALLALVFAPDAEGVDPDRAVRLALIHDLGEAEWGDLPVAAAGVDVEIERKRERERATVAELAEELAVDLANDWDEFTDRESETARFVRDMDLLDMCLQASIYAEAGRGANHEEFLETADGRFRTPVGKALFAAVRARFDRE